MQAPSDRLREADPKSADAIHANNVKRVICAWNIIRRQEQRFPEHNEAEREKGPPASVCVFCSEMMCVAVCMSGLIVVWI